MNGDGEFTERGALATTLKVKDEGDLNLINDSAAEQTQDAHSKTTLIMTSKLPKKKVVKN